MSHINLVDVSLKIPIFDADARSLRANIAGGVVGGRINSSNKVTSVNALEKINLQANHGDRIGVIGANGAGKSTLLRVLAGIYVPNSGLVEVEGNIKTMINIGAGLDMNLTGRENIMRIGLLTGMTILEIKEHMDEIVFYSGVGDFVDLPVRSYSSGMLTRLLFAVITQSESDILLIDEFFSTGDAQFVEQSTKRMLSAQANADIVVFASHSMELLRTFCNRAVKIEAGRLHEIDIAKL